MAEQGVFHYPDSYLEAMAGARKLEKEGLYDEAERVRCQARQALAMYMGAGVVDSKGNPIFGEDGSTQLEKLRNQK